MNLPTHYVQPLLLLSSCKVWCSGWFCSDAQVSFHSRSPFFTITFAPVSSAYFNVFFWTERFGTRALDFYRVRKVESYTIGMQSKKHNSLKCVLMRQFIKSLLYLIILGICHNFFFKYYYYNYSIQYNHSFQHKLNFKYKLPPSFLEKGLNCFNRA